jgi:hypothetical protein
MADISTSWRAELYKAVHQHKAIRAATSVEKQVDPFLIKPATSLATSGPVLWVIDGLEEAKERAPLLHALSTSFSTLPGEIKVIVTSSIETEVYEAFHGHGHIYPQYLHDVDATVTRKDIGAYMCDRLDLDAIVHRRPTLTSWRKHSSLFQTMDERYFAWAALAAPLMSELAVVHPDLDNELFNGARTGHSLHSLCVQFFDLLMRPFSAKASSDESSAVSTNGELDAKRYHAILALLHWVDKVIPRLAPDLRKWISGQEVSDDFPATLHVKPDIDLAQACLDVMEAKLHFNVTQCGSSYSVNDDQENANWLSLDCGLVYACRFWVHHLATTHSTQHLKGQLRRFLYTKLLFWLEVMSILGKIKDAAAMLEKCMSPELIQVRCVSPQSSNQC